MKLCFIDTETTGLDGKENGILQIGGILISNDERVEFNITTKPFESDVITDGALKVNRITRDMIQEFQEPRKAYLEFTKILDQYVSKFDPFDKLHFIAYNAKFDWDFLYEWFRKNADKYFGSYFYFPYIDLMTITAYAKMNERNKFKKWRLCDVCNIFGIPVSSIEQHDALYDAKLTEMLYYQLKK